MNTLILECSPNDLVLDETRFPDTDHSFIYPHLKYYCSKLRPLPAVTASGRSVPPVVVIGHKYFNIARELGLQSIRAIIAAPEVTQEFRQFLGRPSVHVIEHDTIASEMNLSRVLKGFHVFFFDHALDCVAKRDFEQRVAGFFLRIESPLLPDEMRSVSTVGFSCDNTCAEFTALTPVGDQEWYGAFLTTCKDFSREVVPIASYQGRRFAH